MSLGDLLLLWWGRVGVVMPVGSTPALGRRVRVVVYSCAASRGGLRRRCSVVETFASHREWCVTWTTLELEPEWWGSWPSLFTSNKYLMGHKTISSCSSVSVSGSDS